MVGTATSATAVTGTNSFTVSATDASNNTSSVLYISTVSGSVAAADSFTCDSRGNMLTGNGRSYAWDAANRLKTITYSDGTTTEFTYDGYGRRVKIEEKNGSTVTSTKLFVWDGLQIAEERDGINNTVTKRYYAQGVSVPVSGLPSPVSYYYTRDHLGSIRELVDANGQIAAGYDYDPYGRQGSTSTPPTAGLQVWLKADSLGLADGTPVSQWTDQSGNGLHAAQTNTTSQPVYKTNQLNGKPVLRFDGSDDFLQFASGFADYTQGMTVFVVAKPAGVNLWERFFDFGRGAANHNILLARAGTSNSLDASLFSSGGSINVWESGSHVTAGQARVFAMVYTDSATSSSLQLRADGEAITQQNTPRLDNIIRTSNYLAKSNWDGDGYFVGDMAEILIYNRALTPAERTRVETYLAQKYGRNNPASDFGYTGHYTHQKSGLVLAPYRAYDPDLGRWLSRDPIEEAEMQPDGPNIYSYARQNPVNFRDIIGKQAVSGGVHLDPDLRRDLFFDGDQEKVEQYDKQTREELKAFQGVMVDVMLAPCPIKTPLPSSLGYSPLRDFINEQITGSLVGQVINELLTPTPPSPGLRIPHQRGPNYGPQP